MLPVPGVVSRQCRSGSNSRIDPLPVYSRKGTPWLKLMVAGTMNGYNPARGLSGQSAGAIMNKQNTVPCDHCQKAFHGHATLPYLYCGHNRVIVFRNQGGPARFVPVQSTEEAIQIIGHPGSEPAAVNRTA